MLEYLRKLDFTRGAASGIKKYKTTFELEGKSYSIWALKPREAVGLSTKTTIAKRMRIIFVQSKEQIGVLGIVHRNDLVRFQRNRGIGVGSGGSA